MLPAAALLLFLIPSAGLAMPVPGDGPGGDAAPDPNTGENRLAIPILLPLPSAAGGFAPALTLRYSSQRGDGAFGVGWSLEFGEVRRSFRFGIPSFDDADDVFELSGGVGARPAIERRASSV